MPERKEIKYVQALGLNRLYPVPSCWINFSRITKFAANSGVGANIVHVSLVAYNQ